MRRAASASIIICVVLRGGGGGGRFLFFLTSCYIMIWNFLGSEYAWFHYGLLRGAEGWFCFHHHAQSLGEGGEGWFHSTCNTFSCNFQDALDSTLFSFSRNLQHTLDDGPFAFSWNFQHGLDATPLTFFRNFRQDLDATLATFSWNYGHALTSKKHRKQYHRIAGVQSSTIYIIILALGQLPHQAARCTKRPKSAAVGVLVAHDVLGQLQPREQHLPRCTVQIRIDVQRCQHCHADGFFQSCAAPNFFQEIDLRMFMRSFPSEVIIVDA